MKHKLNPPDKLGHQAPVNHRINEFNSIELKGDWSYCVSHNFVYNDQEQEKLLYEGKACFDTDARYYDSVYNFVGNCYLRWQRNKAMSLKACIRKVLKTRNIPVGMVVEFKTSWYWAKKKIDSSYRFKIRKENNFDPDYQITRPEFSANFSTCKRSQKLVNKLRENGFLVEVGVNRSFLMNMVDQACKLTGKERVDARIEGETAIAYGYNKKIGFSSYNNDFMGYSDGCDNVLWDNFGEFDKWSRCAEIPKTTPIPEIIELLKTDSRIEDDETEDDKIDEDGTV